MTDLMISGKWKVKETFKSTKGKPVTEEYEVTIHQDGQSIEMEIPDVEKPVLGKLEGSTAVMNSYSYPEDDGMTKVVKFELKFSDGGNSANHQDTWIWQSNYSRYPKEKGKSEGQWTRKGGSIKTTLRTTGVSPWVKASQPKAGKRARI